MTSGLDRQLSPGMVEVRVTEASDLDRALNDAVGSVMGAAELYRIGVMITRTGPGHYVVRAHPAVPHGLIRHQE